MKIFIGLALLVPLIGFVSCSDDEDDLPTGMFFCLNCDDDFSKCCESSLALPFCCSPRLSAVQEATKKGSTLTSGAFCKDNDDCPNVVGDISSFLDDDGDDEGYDYCCPVANICCEGSDYYSQNIRMTLASLGGTLIGSLIICLVVLLLFSCCLCICRKVCCKRD